jgi:hypothetical protein
MRGLGFVLELFQQHLVAERWTAWLRCLLGSVFSSIAAQATQNEIFLAGFLFGHVWGRRKVTTSVMRYCSMLHGVLVPFFGLLPFRRLVENAKTHFFFFFVGGLCAGVRGVVCRSLFRPGLVAAPCSTQLHRLSPPAVSSAAAQRDTTKKNLLLGVFLFFRLRDVGACLPLRGRVPALCAVWLCCLLPAPVSSLVPLRPPRFFGWGFSVVGFLPRVWASLPLALLCPSLILGVVASCHSASAPRLLPSENFFVGFFCLPRLGTSGRSQRDHSVSARYAVFFALSLTSSRFFFGSLRPFPGFFCRVFVFAVRWKGRDQRLGQGSVAATCAVCLRCVLAPTMSSAAP